MQGGFFYVKGISSGFVLACIGVPFCLIQGLGFNSSMVSEWVGGINVSTTPSSMNFFLLFFSHFTVIPWTMGHHQIKIKKKLKKFGLYHPTMSLQCPWITHDGWPWWCPGIPPMSLDHSRWLTLMSKSPQCPWITHDGRPYHRGIHHTFIDEFFSSFFSLTSQSSHGSQKHHQVKIKKN